jgi:hypothetical protein
VLTITSCSESIQGLVQTFKVRPLSMYKGVSSHLHRSNTARAIAIPSLSQPISYAVCVIACKGFAKQFPLVLSCFESADAAALSEVSWIRLARFLRRSYHYRV